jgi:two-component system, OmpR family, response regulator
MLVLSRRLNETLLFPGIDASIRVVEIKQGVVRLGIEAPREVAVLRGELRDRAAEWEPGNSSPASAAEANLQDLRHLLRGRVISATDGLAMLRQLAEAGFTEDQFARVIERLDQDVQALRRQVEADRPRSAARPAARGKVRRALLVEDNANERELMATFLRMKGLEVDTAGDGIDALDYLHAGGRPDVILLDMGMPRCDGPTTVRHIRQDPAYAGLKIFAVTGRSREEVALEGGAAGVDRWFRKPIDPAVLVRDVKREFEPASTDEGTAPDRD